MLNVYLCKGLPAAGKDTWALELMAKHPGRYKRVNKDLLREMLDGSRWSKDNEKFVLDVRDSLILSAIENGKHVLVTDTNLHSKHEARIRQLVKGKAEVLIQDFTHIDVEECIRRDLVRPNSVGSKVIRGMYNQFLAPKVERPKYNPELPDAIICDLDGTLAELNGRNPYDASSCEKDGCNLSVKEAIRLFNSSYIILLSGRENQFRPQTKAWLTKHEIEYDYLHMRATGDSRKDSIIKEELYHEHIEGKYNVIAVFDDRLQVCRMWHRLGLPLFRVGDPDADF